MPNSYDVDDILEEIKRKKSAKAMPEQNTQRPRPTAWDRVESSASVNAPAAEQLQQASSLEGLASCRSVPAGASTNTENKRNGGGVCLAGVGAFSYGATERYTGHARSPAGNSF